MLQLNDDNCNYDPLDKGNWVQQVESCTCTDCALHPYRPISKPKKASRTPVQAANQCSTGV